MLWTSHARAHFGMANKWVKGSLVVLGAVALSTLGIFASDTLRGIDGGIGQLAGIGASATCTEGSVPVRVDGHVLCVDTYEASPSSKCPNGSPRSAIESERNANTDGCYAASVPDALPWSFVSLPQAQRMCAGAGKRLPTSAEWYHFALGTDPGNCVTQKSGAQKTGSAECTSSVGANDVIGNVWEWVDEQVNGNMFEERELPSEGYISSVDTNGVAVTSGTEPDELYGKDYFWSGSDGVFGMIRGGFYGSGDDAGLYTVNATVQTSFATQGVGFRCVKDIL